MRLVLSISALAAALFAQSPPDPTPDRLPYYLAPNDKITIRAPRAEKLNGKTFQIQADGFVKLPSIGLLQAGGVTIEALEKQIAKRLGRGLAQEPKVVILVVGASYFKKP